MDATSEQVAAACPGRRPGRDHLLHPVPLAAAGDVAGLGAADDLRHRPRRGGPGARHGRGLPRPARRGRRLGPGGGRRVPRARRPQAAGPRPGRPGPQPRPHRPGRRRPDPAAGRLSARPSGPALGGASGAPALLTCQWGGVDCPSDRTGVRLPPPLLGKQRGSGTGACRMRRRVRGTRSWLAPARTDLDPRRAGAARPPRDPPDRATGCPPASGHALVHLCPVRSAVPVRRSASALGPPSVHPQGPSSVHPPGPASTGAAREAVEVRTEPVDGVPTPVQLLRDGRLWLVRSAELLAGPGPRWRVAAAPGPGVPPVPCERGARRRRRPAGAHPRWRREPAWA